MTGQAPSGPVPPVPVTPLPGQDQAVDLATLQSQLGELRIQLAGLQAQWDGLHSQLDAMLQNNPARPGVQQKWADVGVQRAQVRGQIAVLEARIGQRQGGRTGTGADPRGRGRGPFDSNAIVPATTLLILALALPVSFAWARRILRGNPRPASLPPDYTMRLERMEHAIDTVAIEVERISEGQRFVTKILASRPERAAPAESVGAPLSAAAPLALGAGPIEPIRVPERERARQPIITPH